MRYLLKPVQFIYALYAFIVFILLMFLVVPIVIVASFFGKMRGGNAINALCRFWAASWFIACGIRHRNHYEQAHDEKGQFIFVSNHISYIDIPTIFNTTGRQKIRILGKYEMSKIPVFGFIYKNVVVMVNRESAESRAKSVRQLKSIIKKGLSVYIFPEGTFNMVHSPLKEFFDGAFRIAIETETPIKPILFLDTYDRLNYNSIFSLSPGKSRAVFLQEVPVTGLTVKETGALKQKVYNIMEEALIRYNASWISEAPLAVINPGGG